MLVYFDELGTLKEIITERPFRNGDAPSDKIYIYLEGDHDSIVKGYVKFRKPDGSLTTETQFYASTDNLIGKELPQKPLRNFEYFSYEHTYIDNGVNKVGYLFYELDVPDAVLGSSEEDTDMIPTSNNLVVASVRFEYSDSSVLSLGAIPFSVQTDMGIIPDTSINVSQYNYLISLIGGFLSANIGVENANRLLKVNSSGVITTTPNFQVLNSPDLDTIIGVGVYVITGTPTNKPNDLSVLNCFLEVEVIGTSQYRQTITVEDKIYYREVSVSAPSFSGVSWQSKTLLNTNSLKTVNSNILVGNGNIAVQEVLVNGVNIKTICNKSVLGSGNLSLDGEDISYSIIGITLEENSVKGALDYLFANKQDVMSSITNTEIDNLFS